MLLKLSKQYGTYKAGKVIDVEPLLFDELVREGYTSYVQLNYNQNGNNRNSTRDADVRIRGRGKGRTVNN